MWAPSYKGQPLGSMGDMGIYCLQLKQDDHGGRRRRGGIHLPDPDGELGAAMFVSFDNNKGTVKHGINGVYRHVWLAAFASAPNGVRFPL